MCMMKYSIGQGFHIAAHAWAFNKDKGIETPWKNTLVVICKSTNKNTHRPQFFLIFLYATSNPTSTLAATSNFYFVDSRLQQPCVSVFRRTQGRQPHSSSDNLPRVLFEAATAKIFTKTTPSAVLPIPVSLLFASPRLYWFMKLSCVRNPSSMYKFLLF